MSAIPKQMTAEAFFGTPNLHEQLEAIANSDGWNIPAHLTVDVARRAADALTAKESSE